MDKKLDLRIEKTYLSLHNAFTALLEEKRFEAFTVNELCERAMIRRTTFYKHFADKYEYFAFYMKEICAGFQDQLPPDAMKGNINDYFVHMSRKLLRFIEQHEKLVINISSSNVFPVLVDSLMEHITNDVTRVLRSFHSAGELSSEQIEGIASFYSGGLVNTLRQYLKRGFKLDEEQFIRVLSSFLAFSTI